MHLAQQLQELKEQFNTLKEGTGKGADVSVSLQLVRQLASAPYHLRDPFSILAALQKLADEARVSNDPSAARYEAILRQSRPLASSPDFGDIITRLIGSKKESEVANFISKMSRTRGSGFHRYARWNVPRPPAANVVRGVPHDPRRGFRARGVCFNCGLRGYFQKNSTSFRF